MLAQIKLNFREQKKTDISIVGYWEVSLGEGVEAAAVDACVEEQWSYVTETSTFSHILIHFLSLLVNLATLKAKKTLHLFLLQTVEL